MGEVQWIGDPDRLWNGVAVHRITRGDSVRSASSQLTVIASDLTGRDRFRGRSPPQLAVIASEGVLRWRSFFAGVSPVSTSVLAGQCVWRARAPNKDL